MCNNDNIQIFKLLLPKMQHNSAHFKVTSESVLSFLISSKIFCGENYISETETAHGDRLKDNPKCTLFIQQKGISTHTHTNLLVEIGAFWCCADPSCISRALFGAFHPIDICQLKL